MVVASASQSDRMFDRVVLSTHFHKLYINELLKLLEDNGMGQYIGMNYAGWQTCADDILLLSLTE